MKTLKACHFARFKSAASAEQNAGLSGLAVAGDGAVWFGMVRSSSLGRLRDGRVPTFRLPRDNARPYSLAVDADGNVWYADISGYVGMLPARYARGSLSQSQTCAAPTCSTKLACRASGSMPRVMNTMRERRSASGQLSSRTGG
jgi:streptogramin lyase